MLLPELAVFLSFFVAINAECVKSCAYTNKPPGQYLIIDANCTNDSFARVSWYPSSLLTVNKVTIEYDCLNTSASNRSLPGYPRSLTCLDYEVDTRDSPRDIVDLPVSEDVICVFSGCIEDYDFQNYHPNIMTAVCSFTGLKIMPTSSSLVLGTATSIDAVSSTTVVQSLTSIATSSVVLSASNTVMTTSTTSSDSTSQMIIIFLISFIVTVFIVFGTVFVIIFIFCLLNYRWAEKTHKVDNYRGGFRNDQLFDAAQMLDLISISESIITIEQILDTKRITTINEEHCPLPIPKLDNVSPEMESTTSPPSFNDSVTKTCNFNSLEITQLSTNSSHHRSNSIASNGEPCPSPQVTNSHINNVLDNNNSDIIAMATPFPVTHSINEAGYLETTNGFDSTTSIDNYIPKEKYDIPFDNNNSDVIAMATPFPLTHSINEAGYLETTNGFDSTTSIDNYISKEKYDIPFDNNNSDVIAMATPFSLTHSVNEAGYLPATNDFDNTTSIDNYIPKEKYDIPANNDKLFEDVLDIDIEYYCDDSQIICTSYGQSIPSQSSDNVSSLRPNQLTVAVEDNGGYIQS